MAVVVLALVLLCLVCVRYSDVACGSCLRLRVCLSLDRRYEKKTVQCVAKKAICKPDNPTG